MASNSSEVEKGLVLVSVERVVTEQEAEEIRADMELKFTQNRGPTQMGATQGEHATAYALYVEFVMKMVGRYISVAQDQNFGGISGLLREMKDRPKQDQSLLKSFAIKPASTTLKDFDTLDEEIQVLQKVFNERVGALLDVINVMKNLKGQPTQGLAEALVSGIKALNIDTLKVEINTIRNEYFFTIARNIAEAYLLFQNQSVHVAFRKVAGQEADKGEGARIAVALKKLRAYKDPSTNPSNRPGLRPRGVSESGLDKIVDNINELLFYPKIVEADVIATSKKDEDNGVLRSNDPRLLNYVIARHISVIFATFEELGKDLTIKNRIIEKFVDRKMSEWEIQDANMKDVIKIALESAKPTPYQGDILDISILESSPIKGDVGSARASTLTYDYDKAKLIKPSSEEEEEEEEEVAKKPRSSKNG